MTEYRTIKSVGTDELTEKKSRFIGYVSFADTEEAAKEFIGHVRKLHPNASTYVHAYNVGLERELRRYSDDGEPNGTAGIQVLECMCGNRYGLKNVVGVVVRYYGGTPLGTGGLSRCFSGATALAVENAGVTTLILHDYLDITVNYTLSGKVKNLLKTEAETEDIQYTDNVTFTIYTKPEQTDKIIESVNEATGAAAQINFRERVWR